MLSQLHVPNLYKVLTLPLNPFAEFWLVLLFYMLLPGVP